MKQNRREFITGILSSFGILLLGILSMISFIPETYFRRKRDKKFNLGKKKDVFSKNDVKELQIGDKKAILFNNEGVIQAFDASCTHGGCPVTWNQQTSTFICACHGGVFNKKGIPISGPPKYPLKALKVVHRDQTDEIILYES